MMSLLALGAFGASLSAGAMRADGYVLGAGRWTCGALIEAIDTGPDSLRLQAAGWVMGYWSAATFRRETGFVDIVESVGGQAIWEKTVAECRNAPGDTLLYLIANSMISNTR